MGYRSEVVLAVNPDAYAVLTTLLARGGSFFNLFKEATTEPYDGDATVYSWDAIKWYPSYPEVEAVEDFMSRLEDEDMEDSFRFVRVGEDCDDTEQRGNGFPIYIKKSIEIY